MKNKLLSLLLALLMTSSAFTLIACGENDVNSDTKPQTSDSSENSDSNDSSDASTVESDKELTAMEERALVPDDLPEEEFGGRTYTVMTTPVGVGGFDYRTEIDAESINGDSLNDSIYNRNAGIEDRFDVIINVEGVETPENVLNTFVKAGTPDYDLASLFNHEVHTAVLQKSVLNWLDAKYQNLDKPWHNSLANDGAIINGILYAICSDLSLTSMTYTHAFFANLDLAATYNIAPDDLYNTVKEGKWTLDHFITLTENMYLDTDGDGIRSDADTYGFAYRVTNPSDVWFTAFGGEYCRVTEDGKVEMTFMNEKTVSMLEKLNQWHWNTPGMYMYGRQYEEETYFLQGQLVFAPLRFVAAYNVLREMDQSYTMLPFPKWDENQEAYYTNADDKFSTFLIPKTSYDSMDFISIIFEALCAESYKQVVPIYYDEALKGRYSNDPTTAEMVDIIMAGRKFDFAFQFAETVFSNVPYTFRNMIRANNSNLASDYKSKEKMLNKTVDLTFSKFYNPEDLIPD